jgi:sirohydrochlorin ferrochelatase
MKESTHTAAILIGHGSVLSASGSAMIRLAARLREQGVVPIAEAAFLNYSRPTLADAVAKCASLGATKVIVQPYFLVAGAYVVNELPSLVRSVAAQYEHLRFVIGDALGAHPALVALARKRLLAVDPTPGVTTGVLFVAHGTPLASANEAIQRVLAQVQAQAGYGPAAIGYLDCNQPTIPGAFAQLVASPVHAIAVLPYFLQLGRHVRQDLPALFTQASQDYPHVAIHVAHHLDYDLLLAQAAAERIMENLMC